MSLDEERKFCEQVYKKWDFVKRIIELYAEGVSWKGCDLITVDAIKSGVRSMLVTGMGDFIIKSQTGIKTVSVKMPSIIPFEEPGHPFLWPVTRNANHLDNLIGRGAAANEMFLLIAKDMCLGLGVPYELLGQLSTSADAYSVMWGLVTFRGNINTWRDYLGSCLQITWNEAWLLHDLAAYGPVYQVFKAQGIELKKLALQALDAAKLLLGSSLITKKEYEQSIKWFI